VAGTVGLVLWLFFLLLMFRFVMDWVLLLARSYRPAGLMAAVLEITYTATDPPLKALRRVIPPLRLGQVQLDLSFLALILIVQVLLGYVVPRIPF
jgi:YggT family protein